MQRSIDGNYCTAVEVLSTRWESPAYSDGAFTWSGASGTDFWADPEEQLVVVVMSAAPGPIRWHYRRLINVLVYQSLVD